MLPTDYAYAVYRIRALEPKLLNSNEVERMIDAKDARDAYRILNELDYADHIGDITDIASFEEVINAGLKDTRDLLEKITPHNWILNILWYRYDFHNLKTLLKAKKAGQSAAEVEKFLMPLGKITVEKLKNQIFSGENENFNLPEQEEKIFKSAILEAEKNYEQGNLDPQMIDLTLDKIFHETTLNLAEKAQNKFLTDFIRQSIDFTNIQAFLRLKLTRRDRKILENTLSNNGHINKKLFLEHFDKDLPDFITATRSSTYAQAIEKGINYWQEHRSFLELEKMMEDKRTDFIKKAKIISFGPEPLFAYFWAKKNNALIIRMIMICKLNQVDPDEIRARLRELYV